MAAISKEDIQHLREKTGVSVMICRKALERSGGDVEKAFELLKEESAVLASKKSERETRAGIIQSYLHAGKIGSLVEIRCETDFVSRNPDFQNFSKEIAMQIAATNPDDIQTLLESPYIKDQNVSVKDFVRDAVGKFGENIEIKRFSRFEL